MRHADISTKGIGDEIDLVPEFTKYLDPMIFAKGSPSRLKKRLRGQH
jgi:hypothetical protein